MNKLDLYFEWVMNNWFTVLGMIVILSITWYQVSTVEGAKTNIAVECNKYWIEQVEKACPQILERGYTQDFTDFKFENITIN